MDEPNSLQELNERLQKLEVQVSTNAKPVSGTESSEKRAISILSTLQSLVSQIVGLAALFTAGGFVIVNGYLARYTNIHAFSLNPIQYITASLGLLFYLTLVTVIGPTVVEIVVRKVFSKPTGADSFTRILRSYIGVSFVGTTTLAILIRGAALLVVAVAYGATAYGIIPHHLGGGEPIPVYVILNDANEVNEFGFDPVPLHPNVVGVILLAELTDGVLVYNIQHHYAAVIKSDQIAGMIDVNAGEWMFGQGQVGTPEPLSTEMPTSEVTSDETATPQVAP